MSGAGLGAFAQGLAGGLATGKSLENMKKDKPDEASTDPLNPTQTESNDSSWSTLSGILGGIGLAQPAMQDAGPAAPLLGGLALNPSVTKKLGNGLGLGLIGKLLK